MTGMVHLRLLLLVLLLVTTGCNTRSPGKAESRKTVVDTSESTEASTIEGVGTVAPGTKVEITTTYAQQPNPPDTTATANIDDKNATSSTGDAGQWSETLAQLSPLIWIGAACIVAGVIILAITIKRRGMGGFVGSLPIWLGPAISGTGVGFIFLPRFVELAAGPLVSIALVSIVTLLILGLWVAYRNRLKIEKKTGYDMPFTKKGIGV
jgi:hypothetical protein